MVLHGGPQPEVLRLEVLPMQQSIGILPCDDSLDHHKDSFMGSRDKRGAFGSFCTVIGCMFAATAKFHPVLSFCVFLLLTVISLLVFWPRSVEHKETHARHLQNEKKSNRYRH